ncbi:MAG: U32 family peptidase [Firmicutes bacterium]|nr:U32 family peptidase [Bacillota bacterium]NBI65094.1 U32 family peptidase [Clostridiales bacterium]
MEKKKTELLAPAGGIRQLTAAVENGADAVYLGGPLFNARINADNFTEEEIRDSIQYAHLRNVKVYITLNTLVADQEMLSALRYAAKLYEIGADALILQDLGLASQILRFMPDFPLHLSTQGSVYNLSGVEMAEYIGFSRVVLARELSLEEISRIAGAGICDIEIFVHGALCMCYSGQCQMSRLLGDGKRSGNRGLCAQPCRLPYKDEHGRTSYALSPKDLCAVDHIGKLADAGVASLKIEGRMKFPEYVAAVVGIYRKYLDLHYAQGSYQVTDEDRQTLAQIFNRGGFTPGYLLGNPGKSILSGELPKHQGVYVGKVSQPVKGKNLVDVQLEQDLELGDGVEIRSQKLAGNMVTYLADQGNGTVRIGDIKTPVEKGDAVYRLTSGSLMKKLRQSYEEGGPYGAKHRRTVPVDMRLEIEVGKSPVLTVLEGQTAITVTDSKILAERAQKRPLDRDRAERQMRKTGGTPFRVRRLEMDLAERCCVPVSSLNDLRRRALRQMAEKKRHMGMRPKAELPKTLEPPGFNMEKRLAFYFYQGEVFETWDVQKIMEELDVTQARAYVPIRFFMENSLKRSGVEIVPYILNVSKGRLDDYIEKNLDRIAEAVRECGIAIGSLGWAAEFLARGVKVYADYGLNLYNSWAMTWAIEQGMLPVSMSHELWQADDGMIPLMISEHQLETKILTDRKNQTYKIVYNHEQDKSMIFMNHMREPIQTLKARWENSQQEMRIYVP